MKSTKITIALISCVTALLLYPSAPTHAQQLRSAFFMNDYFLNHELNPAMRPDRGYISFPGLGSVNASFQTNTLTLDRLIYPYKETNELVTFLHPSVNTEKFLKGLRPDNSQNYDVNLNIISFGFYSGKGFWNFGINLKNNANITLPKDLLIAAKQGVSNNTGRLFNASNLNFHALSYVEAAIGYSRTINSKLTVGGKTKLLLGIGSFDGYFNNMEIEMGEESWKVRTDGYLKTSMKGLRPKFKHDDAFNKEYINGFEVNNPGISGAGASFDLGATYQLMDNLVLSASALDLGLIHWSKSNSMSARSKEEFLFDGFQIGFKEDNIPSIDDQLKTIEDQFVNLVHYTEETPQARTTGLHPWLNAGAEYSILNKTLGFGLLSSTRFGTPKPYTELTTSVHYRPLKWLSAALSYSWINSDFKTFGFALNFSPKWINFFIASDYMFTTVTPQFIPIKQPTANFQFGISVPIGRAGSTDSK